MTGVLGVPSPAGRPRRAGLNVQRQFIRASRVCSGHRSPHTGRIGGTVRRTPAFPVPRDGSSDDRTTRFMRHRSPAGVLPGGPCDPAPAGPLVRRGGQDGRGGVVRAGRAGRRGACRGVPGGRGGVVRAGAGPRPPPAPDAPERRPPGPALGLPDARAARFTRGAGFMRGAGSKGRGHAGRRGGAGDAGGVRAVRMADGGRFRLTGRAVRPAGPVTRRAPSPDGGAPPRPAGLPPRKPARGCAFRKPARECGPGASGASARAHKRVYAPAAKTRGGARRRPARPLRGGGPPRRRAPGPRPAGRRPPGRRPPPLSGRGPRAPCACAAPRAGRPR